MRVFPRREEVVQATIGHDLEKPMLRVHSSNVSSNIHTLRYNTLLKFAMEKQVSS